MWVEEGGRGEKRREVGMWGGMGVGGMCVWGEGGGKGGGGAAAADADVVLDTCVCPYAPTACKLIMGAMSLWTGSKKAYSILGAKPRRASLRGALHVQDVGGMRQACSSAHMDAGTLSQQPNVPVDDVQLKRDPHAYSLEGGTNCDTPPEKQRKSAAYSTYR